MGAEVLFGSIEKKDRSWRVRATPPVMLRLKRWFAQAPLGSGDSLMIYNNPSNCAELVWILDRYPMRVEPDDYFELVAKAEEQKERERTIAAVHAGKAGIPRGAFQLAIPARDYQVKAAQLCFHSGSLLLADQIGLGKTCASIELLSYEDCLPAIVIAPTHLPKQWQEQISRFAPDVTTHITTRVRPYPWTEKPPDVLITNYFKAVGWAERLVAEGRYKTLILDEGHELRHFDTERYRAISSIRASVERCMLLSGSPIFNFGGEMWAVMNIVKPDALGSRPEFVREWCGGNENVGQTGASKPKVTDPRALGIHLRDAGLMLRRTREDVGRELPPLNQIVQAVEADPERINEISTDLTLFARTLMSKSASNLAKMNAGGQFDLKLRQATGLAKAPHVAHFVRMLLEEGERVVLFGWHRAVYDVWAEMLAPWKPAFYTGEETAAEKEESKRKFIEKETNLLIMSLRSGVGVDGLQGTCNIVVFGELDWSPAVMRQNSGRVHRDGQEKPTFAYILLSDQGSDPAMADVLRLKTGQLEGIIDPHADVIEKTQTDPEHVKKLAASWLARQVRKSDEE